ncbi:hypothetical protein HPB47_016507 [Ixodes persulcatus]|uniref:Uncharacterized protein n=1 Tax=Ixodes persulcatus TaxID=34615 RepID=A0AC60QQR5_IXOPE|nr:hypothetical protein HPB47_016507 [Ixodes persulcatus]
MLALESFDITKQLIPDVMHDMFEGGFAVVLHYTLQGVLSDGILTLSDFGKVATFKAFLRVFSELYDAASVPPKLHYLVHYPRIIERYGPLQQYWCMRFEVKHQYFKSMALENKNFVNIGKSLSTRHQLLQSYELHMNVLDKNVCATGLKAIAPAELNLCAQSLASDSQGTWKGGAPGEPGVRPSTGETGGFRGREGGYCSCSNWTSVSPRPALCGGCDTVGATKWATPGEHTIFRLPPLPRLRLRSHHNFNHIPSHNFDDTVHPSACALKGFLAVELGR